MKEVFTNYFVAGKVKVVPTYLHYSETHKRTQTYTADFVGNDTWTSELYPKDTTYITTGTGCLGTSSLSQTGGVLVLLTVIEAYQLH